ncbi:hypothetical protein [Stenotrophomonas sp.]|uniref:hypothetical protein n=1 Tax=Stenotrophomonas sp. TaxID=69392 RepID=UPI002899CD5E|nr:hypothetical protein [Stenotrophomonas sp.]
MRLTPSQTNFTAGEISPKLYGRSDIERYRNAAEVLENVIILVQGGVQRRPGLRHSAPAKHDDKYAELIPYVFNRSQAYMLEVGDAYIRVFLQNGAEVLVESSPGVFAPFEIVTDYAEADLSAIDYVQSGDTMFLFHPDYVTRRLRRFGDASWILEAVPWVEEPFGEVGIAPAVSMTLDSLALGPGRTITAGGAAFMASDVGREIEGLGGLAVITGYTSATVVTVDTQTPFPALVTAAGQWVIAGSPMTVLTPTYPGGTGTDLPPVGASVTLTLDDAGWRSTDVGKWVELNAGLVQITAVTSATVATATVARALSALVAVPALAWTLKGTVWGGRNGYPGTGTFEGQRLWLAGSRAFPQTVWGSRIGEYLNFELGTNDDDAVSFDLASDRQNLIRHLTQVNTLVVLTNGGEFTIEGSLDKPITPTNVQIRNQSSFGCGDVAPERIGRELVFAQRANRKLRALSADRIDTAQYGAPELTVLADHMTASGITSTAYEAEPDSLLHCVRTDGQLASCAIDRDQDVVGWSRQVTDGRFIAVATLPLEDRDQVWAIVSRTINGVERRYVERFDRDVMTDSCVTATSVAGDTTWLGLDHLEGKTVKVKADGVVLNDQVVAGGQITIERPAKQIEIGLGFTPRVKLLRPEMFSDSGSAQSSSIRISEIVVRVLASTGLLINGQTAFARQTGLGVLDQPPPLLTGDQKIEQLGWELGNFHMEITQAQPYPFHLQAVITTMTVNK